jgi:hypothetical protein
MQARWSIGRDFSSGQKQFFLDEEGRILLGIFRGLSAALALCYPTRRGEGVRYCTSVSFPSTNVAFRFSKM